MALIPDLPSASGLTNTDLLVIDTGSATQKIQVQNAGASASNAGLVTTGAQTFSGKKTFNGTITAQDTSANGATLALKFTDKNYAEAATIYAVLSNYGGRLYLREYSGDASGLSSYGEIYRLPPPNSGMTGTYSYDILTTKATSLSTASITTALGNIGLHRSAGRQQHSVTVSTYYRGFLFLSDSVSTRVGVYSVYSTNTTVAFTSLHSATGLSITGSGLSFSIDAGSGNSVAVMLVDMAGSATLS